MTVPFTSFIYDSTDADVRNWYRRVLREGEYGVSSARMALLDTLVGGIKSDGVWSKLDGLWIHAAENETAALVDLRGGTIATKANLVPPLPTFTTDRGYTFGASSANWLDTTFNPSTAGGNFTKDSCHVGVWVDTLGVRTAVGIKGIDEATLYLYGDPAWGLILNDSAVSKNTGFVTAGHVVGVRSSSTAKAVYGNGGNKVSFSVSSVALVNATFTIGSENGGDNFGTHQVAASHIGGALTDTDVSNLYTRLRTFMTAIGVP